MTPLPVIEVSADTYKVLKEAQADYAKGFGFEPTIDQTICAIINTHPAMEEMRVRLIFGENHEVGKLGERIIFGKVTL